MRTDMIQGVLFDLDGVLVDTLHYHYLAWQHMFEKFGGDVSEHTVLLHEGRKSLEILPILMREAGVTIPEEEWEDFIEQKRAYYRRIVDVRQYPGAIETVDSLRRRGLKVALVTACARQNMRHALAPEHQAHFDFILTGDEVARGKPFPDPYLTAAKRLGVRPGECAVVENAPLGIEAARQAGMRCVAVESTLAREYLVSADCIVSSIAEIERVIESWSLRS